MHLNVLEGTALGVVWIYRALTFLFFDILVSLLIFGTLTLYRSRRLAYTLAWAFMLVLDIANIVYSRFFHQYLSLSSVSEAGNLSGMWWCQYLVPACRIGDLLLVVTSVIFLLSVWTPKCLSKYGNCWLGRFNWKMSLLAICIIVLPHTVLSDIYNINQNEAPKSISDYLSATQGDEFHRRVILEQKLYYCSYGLYRTELFFSIFYPSSDKKLTEKENAEITSFVKEHNEEKGIFPGSFRLSQHCNVSFIIVESYLSAVSDLTVNGQEVTPNLNRLRHIEGTYYNGNMESGVALGESSDAQLMYFTGLQPLASEITVSSISRKHITGLPALLRKKGYNTYMTIPTKKYVWHQDEVNAVYGIDNLYSTIEGKDGFLSEDDDVFKLAEDKEKSMKKPFMHVILTASMHSPYDKSKEYFKNVPLKFPTSYSKEYCNYLRACWFTDKQIGEYIASLQKRGIYNNTVLIIAADHASHPEFLKMSENLLCKCRIPLYIVNANINLPSSGNVSIEQIDVYTSLLDMFGIKNNWRGLGQSIFRPRKTINNSYKSKRSNVSDLIIEGDWLKK